MIVRNVDHNRFVMRNKSLALAEEFDRKGKVIGSKGEEAKTCNNCNRKKHCKKNRVYTGGGSISIGEVVTTSCETWMEQKKGAMSDKQKRSLLKQFKNKML